MGIHGNRDPPYPPLRHSMKTVGGQSQKQSYVHACVQVRPHTHTWPAEVTTWSLKPS